MLSPAERLTGMNLEGGWKVITSIENDVNSTGGNFSKCYKVKNKDGKEAFLKALDFSRALNALDPALQLKLITEAFVFERDILHKCRDENLDHVVVAIEDGTVRIENAGDIGVVQYLIFEMADGDVRKQADVNERFDTAFSLRALHNIAVGLQQLHKHGIAHQDLKPSNVLVFNNKTKSKIADFGRSAYKGHFPPHEEYVVAGDPTYAPPELLYDYIDSDWNRRRLGCDAYLLGSMAVFFFLGIGMTPLLRQELHESFVWRNWGGTFNEAIPYLNDAFQRVLVRYSEALPASLKGELVEIVSQLCMPDPSLRGHPRTRITSQYSLERYVSKFDLMAKRAELGLLDSITS